MSTDPISDLLTTIRNANQRLIEKVDVPSSKIKEEIVRILKEEGFVANYKRIDDHKQNILRIYLKYSPDHKPILEGLRRISRPGLRVYNPSRKLSKLGGGLGISIISTPHGIMTDRQARSANLGGEVLLYVW
ncbi:MAG: 30S ribosomal protein S8 [Elusimicrobiota bacterium]